MVKREMKISDGCGRSNNGKWTMEKHDDVVV